MLDLQPFQNLSLHGGFVLVDVQLTADPLLDPLDRSASAQTLIRGHQLRVLIRADLDEDEISISLYHEILEAVTLAAKSPPADLCEFNEGDFEKAAQESHRRFGRVTPASLNQMLADFGFPP